MNLPSISSMNPLESLKKARVPLVKANGVEAAIGDVSVLSHNNNRTVNLTIPFEGKMVDKLRVIYDQKTGIITFEVIACSCNNKITHRFFTSKLEVK